MIEILQLLFIGAVGIAGIIIWGSLLALPGSFLVWKFFNGEEIEEGFGSFLYHVGLAGALISLFLLTGVHYLLLSLLNFTLYGISDTMTYLLVSISVVIGSTLWSYSKVKYGF